MPSLRPRRAATRSSMKEKSDDEAEWNDDDEMAKEEEESEFEDKELDEDSDILIPGVSINPNEGEGDPIEVSLPRGGYAPVFKERAPEIGKSSVASPTTRPRHGPAIVVLPFENYSGRSEDDGFANGLTEQLIATLSRFSELSVVSRTSAFAFRGVPVGEIREALDVDYVFEGSIRKSDASCV